MQTHIACILRLTLEGLNCQMSPPRMSKSGIGGRCWGKAHPVLRDFAWHLWEHLLRLLSLGGIAKRKVGRPLCYCERTR